ncbi:MAG: hypothetical protein NT062_06285, partial [Proteobacteria bacterium]|nr:hypothetical protein [Pseudomonadota bacterium]
KRRLWFAVIGLLIGVGSGVAELVATSTASAPDPTAPMTATAGAGSSAVVGAGSGSGSAAATHAAGVEPATGSGSGSGSGANAPRPVATGTRPTQPILTPQDLLVAEHAAIGRGDVAELAALAAPHAFAFGLDADEVAEGPAAIAPELPGPFAANGRYPPWDPRPGTSRREYIRLVYGEFKTAGREYAVVAWHWGMAVPDAIAEKLAKDNMLPALGVVPDRVDGSDALEAAVRASLGSREGFAAAWSPRADAFNFGSAGERLVGGALIKNLFGRMRADLALGGGGSVLIVSGNIWDKSQKSDAWIAYAAANVAFAPAGHPSQTFRVLAIYLKEDEAWQLVQTQFSNGGPITIKR